MKILPAPRIVPGTFAASKPSSTTSKPRSIDPSQMARGATPGPFLLVRIMWLIVALIARPVERLNDLQVLWSRNDSPFGRHQSDCLMDDRPNCTAHIASIADSFNRPSILGCNLGANAQYRLSSWCSQDCVSFLLSVELLVGDSSFRIRYLLIT